MESPVRHRRFRLAATVVVWTLGDIGFSGYVPALVADLAPAEARGRYQGMPGLAFGASTVIGPIAGTAVYARLAPAVLWIGCLARPVDGGRHVVVGRAAHLRSPG